MSHPSDISRSDSGHDEKPAKSGSYRHYAGWTINGEPRTSRQSTNDDDSTLAGQCSASREPSIGLPRRPRVRPSQFVITMKDNYINEFLRMERRRAIDFLPPTRATGTIAPLSHVEHAKDFMKELSALMLVGTVDPHFGTATKVSDFLSGTYLHPWVTVIGRSEIIGREPRTRQTFISVVEPPAWGRVELDICVACVLGEPGSLASTGT